jgi:hypothetical protein
MNYNSSQLEIGQFELYNKNSVNLRKAVPDKLRRLAVKSNL